MNYPWLDAYLLSKKGAVKDYKAEWEATRYTIGGKMFALQGADKERKSIITLKCEPSWNQALRIQYHDITAGYYMNKEHWNSLDLNGSVSEDVLKLMIDQSYELIFGSLSKRMQGEILAQME